jgi:hypothetical protein
MALLVGSFGGDFFLSRQACPLNRYQAAILVTAFSARAFSAAAFSATAFSAAAFTASCSCFCCCLMRAASTLTCCFSSFSVAFWALGHVGLKFVKGQTVPEFSLFD